MFWKSASPSEWVKEHLTFLVLIHSHVMFLTQINFTRSQVCLRLWSQHFSIFYSSYNYLVWHFINYHYTASSLCRTQTGKLSKLLFRGPRCWTFSELRELCADHWCCKGTRWQDMQLSQGTPEVSGKPPLVHSLMVSSVASQRFILSYSHRRPPALHWP